MIRGHDTKTISKPAEWTGDRGEYKIWSTLFQAYMSTLDKRWTDVLREITNYDKGWLENKLSGEATVKAFLNEKGFKPEWYDKLQNTLYIALLQYTGGTIKVRVHAMGETDVFQAYRWIHHKGAALDERGKVELRSRVMNAERAESVEDVEKAVLKWTNDIMRLEAVVEKIEDRDKIQPYWSMMPDEVQKFLVHKGFSSSPWENLDRMEREVEDFAQRWKQMGMKKDEGKVLGAMTKDENTP